MTESRLMPLPARGAWPRPPRFDRPWMTRRAHWWYRLMRAGQVHRLMAEMGDHERFVAAAGPRRRLPRALRERLQLAAYGQALRGVWRAHAEAGPLGPALARADHPNYLGDADVVRGLVDAHIGLLIARRDGNEAQAMCDAEAAHLARIFSGDDPAFAPIGAWNTRAGLGEACLARVPLDAAHQASADLPPLLDGLFTALADAVARVVHTAKHNDLAADEALDRLVRLASFTTALLLGLADLEPEEVTLRSLVADLPPPGQDGDGAGDQAEEVTR